MIRTKLFWMLSSLSPWLNLLIPDLPTNRKWTTWWIWIKYGELCKLQLTEAVTSTKKLLPGNSNCSNNVIAAEHRGIWNNCHTYSKLDIFHLPRERWKFNDLSSLKGCISCRWVFRKLCHESYSSWHHRELPLWMTSPNPPSLRCGKVLKRTLWRYHWLLFSQRPVSPFWGAPTLSGNNCQPIFVLKPVGWIPWSYPCK